MLEKLKHFFRALRYQRQLREAISSQLSLLEEDASFVLGGLTEEEEQFIRALVRECVGAIVTSHADGDGEGKGGGPIVEFGTLFGLTTRLIAAEAGSKMDVITVDNFSWNPFGLPPVLHETFTRKILRTELDEGRVSLSVAASGTFRARYSGRVPSMVFLDADHSYGAVRDEIIWAKKLGVPLICGHDYGNPRFGVTKAVDEAFPAGVDVCGNVWARRRKDDAEGGNTGIQRPEGKGFCCFASAGTGQTPDIGKYEPTKGSKSWKGSVSVTRQRRRSRSL